MNIKRFIRLLVIVFTIVSLSAPNFRIKEDVASFKGWTITDVGIRAEPSRNAEIIKILSMGEEITFHYYDNEWSEIKYDEETGFIESDYITNNGEVIDYLMFVNKLEIEPNEETYIEYKEFMNSLNTDDLPETIYDYYTDKEIEMMLQCIETETYDQDFISKVNVANVILNRITNEKFAEEPIEVITSPNQFTYHRTEISESTKNALEYAFLFEDTTQGALYFHSNEKTETFNGATYIFSDDASHHYYK